MLNKKIALVIVTLGHFLNPFMLTSINIALPAIGEEFSINAVLLGWVASSYILASTIFLIPFGKIADIYGRKKIFTTGFIIFTIASLFSAFSSTALMLITLRFIQGVGAAMILSTGLALLTELTPLEERGRYIGITLAMVYFGQAVGPFIGGVLTQNYGWRSIFYVPLPACLMVVLLVLLKMKEEWVNSKVEKVNLISSLIFTISFFLIMYGLSIIPDYFSIWLVIAGFICFLYFLRREKNVDNPLIDIHIFAKNRVFCFSNISALINYSATYAVIFLISLYLQYIHMLTPQLAGLMLMPKAIIQAVFAPIAGNLSDKGDARIYASIGMGLTAISLFMLAFLSSNTSIQYVLLALLLLGLGLGLFVSPNTKLIMGAVDKKYYGVSSALTGTMRQLGQFLSMAIVMVIFTFTIGKAEITPAYYDALLTGTKISFIVFGLISFSGIFFSLARGDL